MSSFGLIVDAKIKSGQEEPCRSAAGALADYVKASCPGVTTYSFSFRGDGVYAVEVYDSAATFEKKGALPRFRELLDSFFRHLHSVKLSVFGSVAEDAPLVKAALSQLNDVTYPEHTRGYLIHH